MLPPNTSDTNTHTMTYMLRPKTYFAFPFLLFPFVLIPMQFLLPPKTLSLIRTMLQGSKFNYPSNTVRKNFKQIHNDVLVFLVHVTNISTDPVNCLSTTIIPLIPSTPSLLPAQFTGLTSVRSQNSNSMHQLIGYNVIFAVTCVTIVVRICATSVVNFKFYVLIRSCREIKCASTKLC
jgi:hypothetical protein